jgi:predicted patatin/cPLA2 family phospholipase
VTDRDTGKPVFLESENCSDLTGALTASASLPLASRPVHLDGHTYLDGGCSLNIPVGRAIEEGHRKIVAVLTRDRSFTRREEQGKPTRAAQAAFYRRYPEMKAAARYSPKRYNEERAELFRLEEEGRIFVIAPSRPITVSRFEKDLDALSALYRMGYEDTKTALGALRDYLDS